MICPNCKSTNVIDKNPDTSVRYQIDDSIYANVWRCQNCGKVWPKGEER